MFHKLICAALIAAALSSSAWSQDSFFDFETAHPREQGERPNWTERELPADYASGNAASCLGTLVYIQTPSAVHLWSAITGTWSEVAVSPTATVAQFNAYAIIQDGSTVHGYATRTGRVETLHLSGTPQAFNGANTSCWLSVVALGSDAWGFSSFDGVWRHQALSNFPQHVDISQTTATLDDGVNIFGISAYFGDFVQGDIALPVILDSAGDVGVAWSATEVAGFSAHTNTWSTQDGTTLNLLAIQRGYAMWEDGTNLVAFSPCTGEFSTHPLPPGYIFNAGRYVATVTAGSKVIGYSSGQNAFDELDFQGVPQISIDDEVLTVHDDLGVRGFTVVTGSFSDLAPGTFNVTLGDAMIWIEDGTQAFALSSLSGEWSAAPFYDAQSQVQVLRNCVVLVNANGYSACSGRTGQWRELASSSPATFTAPSSGDMFVGFEGNDLHVFDPVVVRWASRPGLAPLVGSDVWRQTFVGFDGSAAYGYGLMNNRWSAIVPQGNYQSLDANSSAGMLLTDTHIYTYSPHGTLTTLSRFPEFSRLQPIGAPLRLLQTGKPGSSVVSILGTRADYVPFKPYGTLCMKRTSIFTRVPLGTIPASGLLDFPLDLSGMPSLRGTALHVQNLITPPAGQRWLTNLIAPVIL